MAELAQRIFERVASLSDSKLNAGRIGKNREFVRIRSGSRVFLFNRSSSPFNDSSHVKLTTSKMLMAELFQGDSAFPSEVKQPKTIGYFKPGVYNLDDTPSYRVRKNKRDILTDIEAQFDYPLIIKPDKGTKGDGVAKVCSREALSKALEEVFETHGENIAVIQECIEIKKEFRVIVFDGLCAYAYEKNTDNAIPGDNLNPTYWDGSVPVINHEKSVLNVGNDLAAFIKNQIGMSYAGFDIAIDDQENFWLIEINGAPLGMDRLSQQPGGAEAVENLLDKMIVKMSEALAP